MLSEVRAYLLPTHQCITRTDPERRRFACQVSRFAPILLHVLCGGTVTAKDASGSCAPAYLPILGRGSRTKPSRFGICTCGRVLASITSASIKSSTPLLWADLGAHGPSPAQTNERVFGRGVSALTRSSASAPRFGCGNPILFSYCNKPHIRKPPACANRAPN